MVSVSAFQKKKGYDALVNCCQNQVLTRNGQAPRGGSDAEREDK